MRRARVKSTALGLLAALLLAAPASWAGFDDDVVKAARLLMEWDIPGAAKIVAKVERDPRAGKDAAAQLAKGRLQLMQGKYAKAAATLNQALALDMPPKMKPLVQHFAALAASTDKATSGYKTHTTSGGHFTIDYSPGIDEVLLPYADRMLEQAWSQLTTLFDYTPPAPIRVELYPNVEVLGQVSSLTVKEIKTSGTIALCKYNRLMIVSPRDLVYGYSWLDTLAHEFIHLLVTQKSRNTVPIWLHEGLAKYYEVKWKNGEPQLSRGSEDLLARALKNDKLISFEAMSPSMAKLPSQEATATAFAEVHMVMDFLEARSGAKVAAEIPRLMGTGLSDKQAVASLAKVPWARFEAAWKTHLKGKGLRALKDASNKEKLLFKGDDTEAAELAKLPEQKSRDHTWLGDRLRLKGRYKAAAKQYRKAAGFAGQTSAVIQAKLGHALLQQGQLDAAIAALRKPLSNATHYVLLHLYLGEAYLRQGRLDKAREHLESAIALNPFDPSVHGHLATVYTKLKMQDRADQERKLHERVRVHMQ